MTQSSKNIWFPAKRYGWGWGLPVAWQGWLFLLAWFAVFAGGLAYCQLHVIALAMFWSFVLVMILLLLAVCLAKGEKPRWRWGDRGADR